MSIHDTFSPDDYHFTHLYCNQFPLLLKNPDNKLESALYLLKYALKTTLEQMIKRQAPYFTYIDEVAMASIHHQIEQDIKQAKQENSHHPGIGFAVSIDFTPAEDTGKMAGLALLKINEYMDYRNNSIRH